jgi:hypothetical protein
LNDSMATAKPQIRSAFPTPICIHYLPVAMEVNAELRPLVLERMQAGGGNPENGMGWHSQDDFESWGGLGAQTLFRMLKELADAMTGTRAGGRVTLEWNIAASAEVRPKAEGVAARTRPGAFWAGVYFVDDGYGKSDDEALGGECEVKDPRGSLPPDLPPHLGFRIPGGATTGMSELIRPKSGMILMHPGWVARGERPFTSAGPRVVVEFELSLP